MQNLRTFAQRSPMFLGSGLNGIMSACCKGGKCISVWDCQCSLLPLSGRRVCVVSDTQGVIHLASLGSFALG